LDGSVGEHALIALTPKSDYRGVLKDGEVATQEGAFSGWLPVQPDWTTQIHVHLMEPADIPLDIYLVTRPGSGAMANSVFAQWRDLQVSFAEGS
jgi:hypothetical protein